jgi:hypothetical protein
MLCDSCAPPFRGSNCRNWRKVIFDPRDSQKNSLARDRRPSRSKTARDRPEGDGAAVMILALSGRRRLPNRREHTIVKFATFDGFRYTAGLGYFDDGDLAEIFLNAEKIGTAIETAARDSAVLASLALQHGVAPETIRRALTRNTDDSASGALGTLLDLLACRRDW